MRPRRRSTAAAAANRRRGAALLVVLLCADLPRCASAADRDAESRENKRERVQERRRQRERRKAAEDAAFGRRTGWDRPGGEEEPPPGYHSPEGGDPADLFSGVSIFSTRRPRDALEGLRSGLVNGIAGAAYGLAAFVAGPVVSIFDYACLQALLH